MKYVIFIILFFIYSCESETKSNKNEVKVGELEEVKISDLQTGDDRLIDSLYRNVTRFEQVLIDSVSCNHVYNTLTKEIEFKCQASVNSNTIGYKLLVKDTSDAYDKQLFSPTPDFRYLTSAVVINNKTIDISGLRYSNTQEDVEPVIVWYGKQFGVFGKYYFLKDRDVCLIRGSNYYCNGTNCTNFKVVLIQKFKINDEVNVKILDFPGTFPYTFENVFLFKVAGDETPKIFIVKGGRSGIMVDDFEIFSLNSN